MNRGFLSLLLFYLLLILLIWGCAILFSSCEVLKSKQTNNIDSTSKSSDSLYVKDSLNITHVKKSTEEEKEKFKSEETIYEFPPYIGIDTGVSKPVINNNYYPTRIIHRKAEGEREYKKEDSDSLKIAQLLEAISIQHDEVKLLKEEVKKLKETETKGVGLVTVCLLIIGAIVLLKLSDKIKIGLK